MQYGHYMEVWRQSLFILHLTCVTFFYRNRHDDDDELNSNKLFYLNKDINLYSVLHAIFLHTILLLFFKLKYNLKTIESWKMSNRWTVTFILLKDSAHLNWSIHDWINNNSIVAYFLYAQVIASTLLSNWIYGLIIITTI